MKNIRNFMRVTHRYLGYFMAGIMTIYAISGILLVYRDTDFLKKEKFYHRIISKNIDEKKLGKELKLKNLEIKKIENGIFFFKGGTYNSITGEAKYTKKELPLVFEKMTKLHKSASQEQLGGLNVVFGVCLFFFVLSSFWMFNPKTKAFRRGILFTAAGIILSIILIYI